MAIMACRRCGHTFWAHYLDGCGDCVKDERCRRYERTMDGDDVPVTNTSCLVGQATPRGETP